MLRVRAVGGARPGRIDEHGSTMPGRYYGCDARGTALPHGELVADTFHVRRLIRAGDLEECPAPPESAPTAPTAAPTPAAIPDSGTHAHTEARNA